jgi:imidazole glycerol phosphate synthase glutamine amidotransferase subunit
VAKVCVVDYGIGNLGSAANALRKVGADAEAVSKPELLDGAELVVVPGVGSFGACMRAFRETGFADPVLERIRADKPVLGICVGLQMLFNGSEESPGVPGLSVFTGIVERMKPELRLPEMQWNKLDVVDAAEPFSALEEQWVYFVHSYAVRDCEYAIAYEEYGDRYVAAVARGSLVGVQFHPEKSGSAGLGFLSALVQHFRVSI